MQFITQNKKYIIVAIIEVILLIMSYFALRIKDGELPYIVHMVVSVMFLTMLTLPDYEKVLGKSRTRHVITGILSLLFLLMFSMDELFIGIRIVKYAGMILVAFILSSVYLVTYVYCRLVDFPVDNNQISDKRLNKIFFICVVAVSLLGILTILSTNIGVMAQADVGEVYDMARGIDPMRAWHTIGYVLWCKLLISFLGEDLGVIIKVNCCLWIVVNIVILLYLIKVKKSPKAGVIYTIASLLVYSPYYYNLVGYKDNVFSIGFLAMILYFVYLLTADNNKLWTSLLGCFAMIIVSVTRHGGLVPMFVGTLGIVIFSVYKKDKRKLLLTVVPCVLRL